MRKKILATILMVIMVFSSMLSVFAADTTTDTDSKRIPDLMWDKYGGSVSQSFKVTQDEVKVKFTGKDYSDDQGASTSWRGPGIKVYTTDRVFKGGPFSYFDRYSGIEMKMDAYGEGSAAAYADILVGMENYPKDLNAWLESNKLGQNYSVTASKNEEGDSITLVFSNNDFKVTYNYYVNKGKDIYFSLTGQKCVISEINGETVDVDNTEVGDKQFSQGFLITQEPVTVEFKSTTDANATDYWATPSVTVYAADKAFAGGASDDFYAIDGFKLYGAVYLWYKEVTDYINSTNYDIWETLGYHKVLKGVPKDEEEWATWREENKAGSEGTVTASKNEEGDLVTLVFTYNDLESTYTIQVDKDEEIYFSLFGVECDITNINVIGDKEILDLECPGQGGPISQGFKITQDEVTVKFLCTAFSDGQGANQGWCGPNIDVYTADETFGGTHLIELYDMGCKLHLAAFGDGYASAYVDSVVGVENLPEDWNAWLEANKLGENYSVTASKNEAGDTITIVFSNNDFKATYNYYVNKGKDIYFSLTGEKCVISEINGETANIDNPEVGTQASSKGFLITQDPVTVEFKSTTYENATELWATPGVQIYEADKRFPGGAGDDLYYFDGYNPYGSVHMWEFEESQQKSQGISSTDYDIWKMIGYHKALTGVPANEDEWTTWKKENAAGSEGTVTASKNEMGDLVTLKFTYNGLESKYTIPIDKDIDKDFYFSLWGYDCYITDIRVVDEEEKPTEVPAIPNSDIEDALKEDAPKIVLDENDSAVISKDALQMIKESNKVLEVELPSGLVVSIDPAKITDKARELDLNIDLIFVDKATTVNGVKAPANSIVITPAAQGAFGFEVSFNISKKQLGEAGINGNNIKLFYIDDDGVVTDLGKLPLNEDGSITIKVDHASSYLLSAVEDDSKVSEVPATGDDSKVSEVPVTGDNSIWTLQLLLAVVSIAVMIAITKRNKITN